MLKIKYRVSLYKLKSANLLITLRTLMRRIMRRNNMKMKDKNNYMMILTARIRYRRKKKK